jgi:hypothetical protein
MKSNFAVAENSMGSVHLEDIRKWHVLKAKTTVATYSEPLRMLAKER